MALRGGSGGEGTQEGDPDPRRRGADASSRALGPKPRAAPHPPRCSYVLVVTVAPRLVLEPGPATRATAAALPGRRRGRRGSEGLGPRAVLLRPLAAQEVAGLRGRREGARGVDLAREPLVQRSHRCPRPRWLPRGRSVLCLPLSGSRSPPPPGGEGRSSRRKGSRRLPLLPRATLKSPPGDCLARLLRPLPRRLGGAGGLGV